MNIEEQVKKARGEAIASRSPMFAPVRLKAYEGKSRAAAIKAMCLDCSHDNREEIRSCSVYACPLREFRPFQETSSSEGEE